MTSPRMYRFQLGARAKSDGTGFFGFVWNWNKGKIQFQARPLLKSGDLVPATQNPI